MVLKNPDPNRVSRLVATPRHWCGRLVFFVLTAALMLVPVAGHAVWLDGEVSNYVEGQRAAPMSFLSRFGRWLSGSAAGARPPVGTTFTVQSSAYAPSPLQTDSTPCITAAGTRVRPGVVATNFLPMGTLLKIDGQVFIVEDRMNPRYQGRFVDIWYPSTAQALEHGRKNLAVEIIGYGTPGQDVRVEPATHAQDETVEEPSFLKRANLRFIAWSVRVSQWIPTNVNRYDVRCH